MSAFRVYFDFPLSDRSNHVIKKDNRASQFDPIIDPDMYFGTRQVRNFSDNPSILNSIIINIYHPLEKKEFFIKTIQILDIESMRTIDGNNEVKVRFIGNVVKLQEYSQGSSYENEGTGQTIKSVSPMVAFPDGAIVQVLLNVSSDRDKPKFIQWNLCYVESSNLSVTPTEMGFDLTLPGIEKKMQQNRFFVDQITQKETKSDSKYSSTTLTSTDLMVDYDKLAKEFSDLKPMLNALWDNLIYRLNRIDTIAGKKFSFGGKPFIAKSGDDSKDAGFLRFETQFKEGYSSGFLNILQLPSQLMQLGQTLDFWEMLSSYAIAPLYELFCDPLQGSSILKVEEKTYTVEKDSAKLIFRKTPFDSMFNDLGEWDFKKGEHYLIPFEHLINYNISRSTNNVYSGIHVGLSSFVDYINVVAVKPFFDNYLRAIYGNRVMQIKLPGMSALSDKKETNKSEPSKITGLLKEIQDKLAKIFINSKDMKHLTGTFTLPLTLFRVGTPFRLLDLPDRTEKERKFLELLPLAGYITTVTDKISIESQTAETMVQFKWCPEKYNTNSAIDLNLIEFKRI